jgi:hypothetical protein
MGGDRIEIVGGVVLTKAVVGRPAQSEPTFPLSHTRFSWSTW